MKLEEIRFFVPKGRIGVLYTERSGEFDTEFNVLRIYSDMNEALEAKQAEQKRHPDRAYFIMNEDKQIIFTKKDRSPGEE